MDGVAEIDRELGDAFRAALLELVGPQRFATWFEGAVRIAVDEASADAPPTAKLVAPSAFEQSLIRQQFADELQQAAHRALGAGGAVRYVVDALDSSSARPARSTATPERSSAPPARRPPTHPSQIESKPATKAPAPAAVVTKAGATKAAAAEPKRHPLGGWIEGASNAAPTRLCRQLISGSPAPSPILIWGPSGVGKTHLLRAIATAARARKLRVRAAGAEDYLRGFVEAARTGAMPEFRQRHDVDWLLIDDLQLLCGKTRTVEEFRQTLDAMIESGGQIVLTADRGPAQLRELGPEVASRIAGGLAVEVPMPDVDVRTGLVRQAAERVGLEMPGPIARTLASRLIGGGREVSGAVHRLALIHETFGAPIDAAMVRQVADDTNRLSTPPVRLADIQKAICGVFDVDLKTLRSGKRTKEVTEPRMLAMWLARKMTGSPWSEIGEHFGRRSHSTVIAAHRRVERLLESGEPTQLCVGELGETIRRVEAALRCA